MNKVLPAISLASALLTLGCQDPVDRPGTWQPTGANDDNLRAMVANPYDLQVGHGAATDRGNSAARAVNRLLTDRRRPLPTSTLTQIGTTSNQADNPDAGNPAPQAPGGSNATQ